MPVAEQMTAEEFLALEGPDWLELDGTKQLTSPLLPGFALGVDEAFMVPSS